MLHGILADHPAQVTKREKKKRVTTAQKEARIGDQYIYIYARGEKGNKKQI